MGDLNIHDISQYCCNIFIETGTGLGEGLDYALQHNFEHLYSIEIIEDLYKKCAKRFECQKNVTLFNSNSIAGLVQILPNISAEKTILFWLDAHFPGVDFQIENCSHDDNLEKKIKIPLDNEIETILKYRPNNKDSFIIDDLNQYDYGKYELGMSPIFGRFDYNGIEWIKSIFSSTHNVTKDFRHQGFLILTPK